ncbi:MAG: PepSY domain-containing protein [Aquificota bacterium]|nr:PepSY domain-containing protein [Aquificota bacterium]
MVFPLVLLLTGGLVLGGDHHLRCLEGAIGMLRAVEIAEEHVGKPYKVWISRSRRTGECFWKVKGIKGYVILDAKTGEVVRFYRSRQ